MTDLELYERVRQKDKEALETQRLVVNLFV